MSKAYESFLTNNIKVTINIVDGYLMMLKTEYQELMKGFEYLQLSNSRQFITIYPNNIIDSTSDSLSLDLSDFKDQVTDNEFYLTIYYYDRHKQLNKFSFEDRISFSSDEEVNVSKDSTLLKDIYVLPFDLEVVQNSFGDIVISTSNIDYLNKIETVHFSNPEYKGWMPTIENEEITIKNNELIIPSYIFISNIAIPCGSYTVEIEADNYDNYQSPINIQIEKGAKLIDAPINVYQDSDGNFCIFSLNTDWLNNLHTITFYFKEGGFAEVGFIKAQKRVDKSLLVIAEEQFDENFSFLLSGDYYVELRSSGYADYLTPTLVNVTTNYQGGIFNHFSMVQSHDGDILINCDNQTWLSYLSGIVFYNVDKEEVGVLDLRNDFFGVTRYENNVVIAYKRVFRDIDLVDNVYAYRVLNHRKNDSYFSRDPFEVVRYTNLIDFDIDCWQEADGDVVIKSLNTEWLAELLNIRFTSDKGNYSYDIQASDKAEYFEGSIRISFNNLKEKTRLLNGSYQVEITSLGFETYINQEGIKVDKGLPEAFVLNDLNVYQDDNNDLVIASSDYDWLLDLSEVVLTNRIKQITRIDLNTFKEGIIFKDNHLVITISRLLQEGLTKDDYRIKLLSNNYQDIELVKTVAIRKMLTTVVEDLKVFQNQDGDLQISTSDEYWLNSIALLKIKTISDVQEFTKLINLKANDIRVKIVNKSMVISLNSLKNQSFLTGIQHFNLQLCYKNGNLAYACEVFVDLNKDIVETPEDLLVYPDYKNDLVISTSDEEYLLSLEKIVFANQENFVANNELYFNRLQNLLAFDGNIVIANDELIKCGVGFGKTTAFLFARGYQCVDCEFESDFSAEVPPCDLEVTHQEDGSLRITSNNEYYLEKIKEISFESLSASDDFVLGSIFTNDSTGIDFVDNALVIASYRLRSDLNYKPTRALCVVKTQGYINVSVAFEFIKVVDNSYHLVFAKQDSEGDLTIRAFDSEYLSNIEKITLTKPYSKESSRGSVALSAERYGVSYSQNEIHIDSNVLLSDGEFESGYYTLKIAARDYPDYESGNIVEITKGIDNTGYLTCIFIDNYPKQMITREGQMPNLDGIVVLAQYSDNSVVRVEDFEVVNFNSTPGIQDVTLRFLNKEASYKVEVIRKTLTRIMVGSLPEKIVYLEGEAFEDKGLRVVAIYDNDTTEIINDYDLSGYQETPGLKRLRATYKDKVCEFNVKVIARVSTQLVVTSLPYKLEYQEGEQFNSDGMEVVLHYNNHTSEIINDYLIFGYDSTAGIKKIGVLADGKKAEFEVRVIAKTLLSIKAEAIYKPLEFVEGSEFEPSTIKVLAYYSNNTTELINDFEYSGYDVTPGIKSVYISYGDKRDVVNVKVRTKRLERINVINLPYKLVYVQGEVFDDSGIQVMAYYDNGTKEIIRNYQIIASLNVPGPQKVKVKYESKIDLFTVEVRKQEITNITVTTKPNKYRYLEGEHFDITGIVITAFYNDGSYKELDTYQYTGYDSTPGIKDIVVFYEGMSDSFEVEVLTKSLTHIQLLRKPFKLEYDEGDELSLSGLDLRAYYDNNTSSIVEPQKVAGFDPTPGFKHISLEYEGKYEAFEVFVNERKLTTIKINKLPNKLQYIEGEGLDLSGIEVIAYYRNNIKNAIGDYVVDGFSSTPGTKRITITHESQSDSFNVEVLNKKIVSLQASVKPKRSSYLEGDIFDPNDLLVVAYYDNDTQEVLNHFLVSGFESTPGTKIVNVSYGGKTDSVMVEVTSKQVVGLRVSVKPLKLNYLEGESFNKDGMIVSLIYSNGTTEDTEKYQILGYTSTPGRKSVTVQQDGFSDSFSVKVASRRIQRLEVTKKPDKLLYLEGEIFDSFGMNVTAFYNNGTFETILGYIVSGFDSTVGIKKIIVTYEGKSDIFNVEVLASKLVSISVIKLPLKTTYLENEIFNPEGMVVRAFYNNNTQKTITDYKIFGYDGAVGTKAMVVSYREFSDAFNVEVLAKTLIGISVVKKPDKLLYLEEEVLNLDGIAVKAFYNNNTKELINDYLVSGYDSLPGAKRITITYQDRSDAFNVKVLEKRVERIQILARPSKLVYLEEEKFDPSDLLVQAFYDNNTHQMIEDYEIIGYDFTPGKKKITVTHQNKSDHFFIEVMPKQLSYLTVSENPFKLVYLEGEEFNPVGMEVRAFYNNGTNSVISNYRLENYDSNPGKKDVLITYQDYSVTLNIEVKPREISFIKVGQKPDKVNYLEGEDFDNTGMIVTAYYNNGSSSIIKDYKVTGYDSSAGTKRVVVSTLGFSDDFTVRVQPRVLNKIVVTSPLNKTVYLEGDSFNENGLQVTAYYDNNTSESLKDYDISGYDSNPGIKNIIVAYQNKITTFMVEVKSKELTHISISKPPLVTRYVEGEYFNSDGMIVMAYYNNNTKKEIFDYQVAGFDGLVGSKSLRVIYQDKQDVIDVEIVPIALTKLRIATKPLKTVYLEGDSFEASGMSVLGYYNNGTSKEINDYLVSGYQATPGSQKVTITYQDQSTDLLVFVHARTLLRVKVITKDEGLYFIEGEDFDRSKVALIGYYDNSTTEMLEGFEVSGYDSTPGVKTLRVRYGEFEEELAVEVKSRVLSKIKVTYKPNKLVYFEGENIELDGLLVTAYYNNLTSKVIDTYEVSGYTSTPGKKTIKVEYGGKVDTFTVDVTPKSIIGLTIVSDITPLAFFEGEVFDQRRITVTAFYNDNTQIIVDDYDISGYDSKPGKKKLTVKYKDVKESFRCFVVAKKAVGLNVTRLPDRTLYVEDEPFDKTGLEVMLFYQGDKKELINNYRISGYESSPGEKLITISYSRKLDYQGNVASTKSKAILKENFVCSFKVRVLPKVKRK